MKELPDGRWELDSAFEADRIGRVAAHGKSDVHRYFFSHQQGQLEYTSDEAEFFRREFEYGKLIINKTFAKRAEAGLKASEVPVLHPEDGEESRINSSEAAALLGALALSRQTLEEAVAQELATIEEAVGSHAEPVASLSGKAQHAA